MAKRQKKGQLLQKYLRHNEINLDKFAKRGCRARGGAILAVHRMLENQKKYDFYNAKKSNDFINNLNVEESTLIYISNKNNSYQDLNSFESANAFAIAKCNKIKKIHILRERLANARISADSAEPSRKSYRAVLMNYNVDRSHWYVSNTRQM